MNNIFLWDLFNLLVILNTTNILKVFIKWFFNLGFHCSTFNYFYFILFFRQLRFPKILRISLIAFVQVFRLIYFFCWKWVTWFFLFLLILINFTFSITFEIKNIIIISLNILLVSHIWTIQFKQVVNYISIFTFLVLKLTKLIFLLFNIRRIIFFKKLDVLQTFFIIFNIIIEISILNYLLNDIFTFE